ncbi:MAG: hypothetical protein OEM02_01100 [Desulfobulbaceae bacterium]|nr:hypothetical protein [Desulfobulbaceae bacterium]
MKKNICQQTYTNGILEHLNFECEVMFRYALASGLQITPGIAAAMSKTGTELHKNQTIEEMDHDETSNPSPNSSNHEPIINSSLFGELVAAHNELARIVAPATPRSLTVTEGAARIKKKVFTTIPLLNRLMSAAISCLIIFIWTGSSEYVGVEGGGNISTSSGLPFLLNQLNFLAAAGLGSSFYALFTVNRFVIERTYEPVFESAYWIRFTLGLISGTILANFIQININPQVSDAMEKATVAMLGGFSAEAVYRILNRLVDAIITLVRGGTKEYSTSRELLAKTRLNEQHENQRIALANNLVSLHEKIKSEPDKEIVSQHLAKIISDLTGEVVFSDNKPSKKPPAK